MIIPLRPYLLTLALISVFSSSVIAQIWLSNEDIYEEAEEFFNAEEYIEALPLYLLLEKKEIMNGNIAYKIGECYLNIRGKKAKAIPYLEQAVEHAIGTYKDSFSETHAPLESLLSLGVAYRIDGQLDEAEKTFNILEDSLSGDYPLNAIVDIHLGMVKNARLLGAFPGEPRTERLPDRINNAYSNYNPVLVGHDSLLYYMEELPFYDALMQTTMEGDTWGVPVNLTPEIGSDGDHILVSANQTGDQLFLYFYVPLRMGEIFTTRLTSEGWTPLEPLNNNINTPYNETHASVSSDGNTLYFTSNRPGGFGGLDIYKSVLTGSGDWGPAINLGPVINTAFNEENPIMNSDDEILYFSSQGHLSMGGYDVFYALKRDEETWRQPINMGAPISSTDDDLFYYPLESTVSGLMSRLEEPDARGYDIYRYNSMVFANSPRFTVRGKVDGVDSTNYQEYAVNAIDNRSGEMVYSTQPAPDGRWEMVLPSSAFTIAVVGPDDKEIGADELVIGENSEELIRLASTTESPEDMPPVIAPVVEPEQKDTVWLQPVLFSFDRAQLPGEYKGLLDSIKILLKKYPGLTVRIEGHTDALGSEEYNMELSGRRAESVKQYLLDNPRQDRQIVIEAKGENEPVALNVYPDGRDCPEGRKFNRRVLIIPLSEIEQVLFLYKEIVPDHLKE